MEKATMGRLIPVSREKGMETSWHKLANLREDFFLLWYSGTLSSLELPSVNSLFCWNFLKLTSVIWKPAMEAKRKEKGLGVARYHKVHRNFYRPLLGSHLGLGNIRTTLSSISDSKQRWENIRSKHSSPCSYCDWICRNWLN